MRGHETRVVCTEEMRNKSKSQYCQSETKFRNSLCGKEEPTLISSLQVLILLEPALTGDADLFCARTRACSRFDDVHEVRIAGMSFFKSSWFTPSFIVLRIWQTAYLWFATTLSSRIRTMRHVPSWAGPLVIYCQEHSTIRSSSCSPERFHCSHSSSLISR